MKTLTLLILVASYTSWTGVNAHGLLRALVCDNDKSEDFHAALNDFAIKFSQRVAVHSLNHFVVSPLTIWLTISAIAEAAHGSAQLDMFEVLNLPSLKCVRQQYYQIAQSLQDPSNDVFMFVHRGMAIDDSLLINRVWQAESSLNVTLVPIKDQRFMSSYLRKTIFTPVDLTPNGYSVLTNTFNFKALWTTAFSGMERAPFYNDAQQQIGTVNYMTARMQVKIARLSAFNAAVIELPVGYERRYSMLFATGLDNTPITNLMAQFGSTTITKMIGDLISYATVNMAIPQFEMTTEFDARFILEQLGIVNLWADDSASRHVSKPAPVPVGLLHHASVALDYRGVYPSPQLNIDPSGAGVANVFLNKPFIYILIDSKYKTALLTGAYSIPTPTAEVKWIV